MRHMCACGLELDWSETMDIELGIPPQWKTWCVCDSCHRYWPLDVGYVFGPAIGVGNINSLSKLELDLK